VTLALALDQAAGSLRWGQSPPRVVGVDLLPSAQALVAQAGELILLLPGITDRDVLEQVSSLVPRAEAVLGVEDGAPAPTGADRAIFVAADRVLRRSAADQGWQPAPHPAVALGLMRGERYEFARVTGDRAALVGLPSVVPYAIEDTPGGGAALLGLLPRASMAAALEARLGIERLAIDAGVEDPLLVQLGGADAGFGEALAGRRVLWTDGSRVLIALDAATRNDEIPVHGPHGHFVALAASPELLAPVPERAPAADGVRPVTPAATDELVIIPAPVTAASFAADVERYAGTRDIDAAGRLRSRHSSHPDNARAVAALQADLAAIGYAPQTHSFSFLGRTLHNVTADLPGVGDGLLEPALVILGCHLDSTAARDAGYDPAVGAARGADDDASGIAATLAIARHLWGYRRRLRHSVRFGFFNAEESGLVGSKAYAAALKASGAPVRAVVCCDMIGHNSDVQRIFEVHAGYTDAPVRDASLPIAGVVAESAASLGALAPAQVYSGTIPVGGTDRRTFDGAINRSDHAAFHQQGYPAVVVTEDFFPNDPGEPATDANPNYHMNADTAVDADYGADITQAVSVAVLQLAIEVQAPAGGASIRVAAGTTPPGAGWQQYTGGGSGLYLDVDTSAGAFAVTPVYVATLHGSSSHWATTGGSAIYTPSPAGFRVYVRYADGSPLTPADAATNGWHVRWHGVEQP
jgi:hypothetical protein